VIAGISRRNSRGLSGRREMVDRFGRLGNRLPCRHQFAFNEAMSFMAPCDSQEEIDYFWGELSADPKAEQCGWLKDRYGVSRQVTRAVVRDLVGGENPERTARVTHAFLKMKKFDVLRSSGRLPGDELFRFRYAGNRLCKIYQTSRTVLRGVAYGERRRFRNRNRKPASRRWPREYLREWMARDGAT
jgi:hypothetical protein